MHFCVVAWIGLQNPWPLVDHSTETKKNDPKSPADVDLKKHSAARPDTTSQEMKPAAVGKPESAADDDGDKDSDDDSDVDGTVCQGRYKSRVGEVEEADDDSDSCSDLYPGYFADSEL